MYVARFALVVAIVQALATTNAQAQDWTGVASVDSTAGYTDNIAPNIQGAKEADYFLQLTPSGLFRYETPRSVNQLSYSLSAFLYAENTDANSTAHNVRALSRIMVTPRAQLQVDVTAAAGQLNTLQLATPSQDAAMSILVDTSEFVSLSLNQRLRWRLDRETVLLQQYGFNIFDRFHDDVGALSRATDVATSVGVEREWLRDSAGLSFGISLIDLITNRDCRCPEIATLTQFDFTLSGRWQRRITPRWTSTVSGGVTFTQSPGRVLVNTVRPSGAAELAYFDTWGGLVLAYQHTIQPSLTIAQNTTSDETSVRAWLPVPYLRGSGTVPRVTFASTLGAQYGRIINLETNATPPDWTTVYFDASIFWMIVEPSLFLSARYMHTRQRGEVGSVASYDRNAFVISISGSLSKGRPQPRSLRSRAADARESNQLEGRGDD